MLLMTTTLVLLLPLVESVVLYESSVPMQATP